MKKWERPLVQEISVLETQGGTGAGRTEEEILGDYPNSTPGWDWEHEDDPFYQYWVSSPKGTTVES